MARPKASADPGDETPTTEHQVAVSSLAAAFVQAMGEANDIQDRKRDKNNPNPEYKSVFRPDGESAYQGDSALSFESIQERTPFLNNARIREDQLTPEEFYDLVQLSRSLVKPGDKKTARDGKYEAFVSANNKALMIIVPCRTEDDRMEAMAIPSLRTLVKELMFGEAAVNPDAMADTIAKMQREIAALKSAQA